MFVMICCELIINASEIEVTVLEISFKTSARNLIRTVAKTRTKYSRASNIHKNAFFGATDI